MHGSHGGSRARSAREELVKRIRQTLGKFANGFEVTFASGADRRATPGVRATPVGVHKWPPGLTLRPG